MEDKTITTDNVVTDTDLGTVDSTAASAGLTKPAGDTSFGSRDEALAALGLRPDADAAALDQRFYQLTKRYRIEKDEENLLRITAAYDVASGRAAEKEAEIHEKTVAKRTLGKTKREWKTFFYYSWWKFAMVAAVIFFFVFVGGQLISGNNFDIRIVCLGHFKTDVQFITDFFTEELSYSNPYVVSSDIDFADPTARGADAMNESLAAYAYLSATPDIILLDEPTVPYFLDYLQNLDAYYEKLRLGLPAELFETIEPVSYSLLDSYKLRGVNPEEYEGEEGIEDAHIYGLKFKNPELYQAFGFMTKWDTGDKPVVIAISATTEHIVDAELFVTNMIQKQDVLIKKYEAVNGAIAIITGRVKDVEETDASVSGAA